MKSTICMRCHGAGMVEGDDGPCIDCAGLGVIEEAEMEVLKKMKEIKVPTKEDIIRFVVEAPSHDAAMAVLMHCHAIDWENGGDLWEVAREIRKNAGINDFPNYQCLVCGKAIVRDDFGMIETDATYFSSHGNWPSSVWDSCCEPGEPRMEIWICKECLKANLDRTRIFVQEVKVCKSPLDPNSKEMSYKEFEEYEKKKYEDRLLAFKEDSKDVSGPGDKK